ncbi:urease accessory protein UreD [Streptomyces sp. NPDC020096]
MTAVALTLGPAPASGVRAAARIVAAPDGRGGTALPVLDGAGPLALRRTRAVEPGAAQITVVGAMSAPLGGDRLSLDTRVRAGARLAVGSAAATVSLPGRCGRRATYDVRLTVETDAELRWLPEPLIAAAGSDLAMTTRVDLAEGARLMLREELVLGRAGEQPGRLVSRVTVRLDGRALLDQELALGPGAPGWSGPAVLDRYRAVGQLLVVDPRFRDRPCGVAVLPSDPAEGEAVLTPLAGPAVLVTALAQDALMARRLLDAGQQAAAR